MVFSSLYLITLSYFRFCVVDFGKFIYVFALVTNSISVSNFIKLPHTYYLVVLTNITGEDLLKIGYIWLNLIISLRLV